MRKYTVEQLEFLKINYATMLLPELTRVFNNRFKDTVTESRIHAALKNHKIRCGRGSGKTKGRSNIFTPEQVEFIKTNYCSMSQKELTVGLNSRFKLNIKDQQIKTFTRNHHIKSGRTGCFEKGYKPANKGTKGLTGANPGSFKSGHPPANLKSLGSERVSVDGYIEVKCEGINPHTGYKGVWRLKHAIVWEQTNGPVPPGYAVFFRDSDKLNCDISNLVLVSREELVRLNQDGYSEVPGELKPSMLAVTKLKTKVFQKIREVRI